MFFGLFFFFPSKHEHELIDTTIAIAIAIVIIISNLSRPPSYTKCHTIVIFIPSMTVTADFYHCNTESLTRCNDLEQKKSLHNDDNNDDNNDDTNVIFLALTSLKASVWLNAGDLI